MVPWLDFSITKNAIKMMKRLDEDTRNRILNGIYTCKLNTVTIVAVLPHGDVYKHI